jgi:hypothetical protein
MITEVKGHPFDVVFEIGPSREIEYVRLAGGRVCIESEHGGRSIFSRSFTPKVPKGQRY